MTDFVLTLGLLLFLIALALSLVILIRWILCEMYWLPMVLGLIVVGVALWRY